MHSARRRAAAATTKVCDAYRGDARSPSDVAVRYAREPASGPHMTIIEGPIRRKRPGHALVHLSGDVHGELAGVPLERGGARRPRAPPLAPPPGGWRGGRPGPPRGRGGPRRHVTRLERPIALREARAD